MLDKKERNILFDHLNYLLYSSPEFDILETWTEFPLVRSKLYKIACRLPYEDLDVLETDIEYIKKVDYSLEVIKPHVEIMSIGGQDFDNDIEDAIVMFETVRRDTKRTLDTLLEV